MALWLRLWTVIRRTLVWLLISPMLVVNGSRIRHPLKSLPHSTKVPLFIHWHMSKPSNVWVKKGKACSTPLESVDRCSSPLLYGHFSIFLGKPGLAGFIQAKDDGNGGDNWRYKSCKLLSDRHRQQTNTQHIGGKLLTSMMHDHCDTRSTI